MLLKSYAQALYFIISCIFLLSLSYAIGINLLRSSTLYFSVINVLFSFTHLQCSNELQRAWQRNIRVFTRLKEKYLLARAKRRRTSERRNVSPCDSERVRSTMHVGNTGSSYNHKVISIFTTIYYVLMRTKTFPCC